MSDGSEVIGARYDAKRERSPLRNDLRRTRIPEGYHEDSNVHVRCSNYSTVRVQPLTPTSPRGELQKLALQMPDQIDKDSVLGHLLADGFFKK